jgi:hypothetical protein
MHPLVYYVTRTDRPGQVKSGTTLNLDRRMSQLRTEGGEGAQVTLLAVEPGGRMMELNRHTRFAPMRLDGEWFTHGAPIIHHVMELDQVPVVFAAAAESHRMPVVA